MRRMNWTWDDRSGSSVRIVNDECLRLKGLDRTKFAPFRGPLDRFRWTTTAGYFMCWYSMQVNVRFSGDYADATRVARADCGRPSLGGIVLRRVPAREVPKLREEFENPLSFNSSPFLTFLVTTCISLTQRKFPIHHIIFMYTSFSLFRLFFLSYLSFLTLPYSFSSEFSFHYRHLLYPTIYQSCRLPNINTR